MTIRGAELLSADLKDCDEIHIGGSHQSPLIPPHTGLGLDLHLQFEFRFSEHMHAAPASMM